MGKLFNPDSPIMIALGRLADLVVLNVLFVLCCIPVVTIGAALAALYDTVYRLQQEEGHLYGAFFRALKSNFRQATIQWLILLVVGALLAIFLHFFVNAAWSLGQISLLITVLMCIIWCAVTAWVFPLQSRFSNSVKNTLRNALLCATGYLPRSLVMVILNVTPWALAILYPALFLQISIAWILIWFSLTASINLQVIKKPLQTMMEQADP